AYIPLLLLWCFDLWIGDKVILCFLTPMILMMILGSYELHAHEKELLFKIKVLQFVLLTRKATPETIKRMEFKRVGWSTKQVLVRVRTGLRWSLVRFQPEDYTVAMRDFAERHSIPVDIHRDFTYL
ncbi:MAG: hypothetical protein WCC10_10670, partial [Tumebacillaceae bacterium]